jgi:hypothetical protein
MALNNRNADLIVCSNDALMLNLMAVCTTPTANPNSSAYPSGRVEAAAIEPIIKWVDSPIAGL